MQVSALMEIRTHKKMEELLKQNSYWLKELNRNPNQVKTFITEMKKQYHLRPTDKISDAIDNIDMINHVLNALK